MTAAPYCSTRTLIIGQRPLTNQRIIEEGLRIVFFLSLSLFLSLLFLRKTGKNAAPSFSNLRYYTFVMIQSGDILRRDSFSEFVLR